MLNIEVIKFEAQDVITASGVAAPTECTHPNKKFVDMPDGWPDNYTCPDCGKVEWQF